MDSLWSKSHMKTFNVILSSPSKGIVCQNWFKIHRLCGIHCYLSCIDLAIITCAFLRCNTCGSFLFGKTDLPLAIHLKCSRTPCHGLELAHSPCTVFFFHPNQGRCEYMQLWKGLALVVWSILSLVSVWGDSALTCHVWFWVLTSW